MKRLITTLALGIGCFVFAGAQQIINTNTKSTCTYEGSENLQGCTDETTVAVFTFNENQYTFTHQVNGVEEVYAIENKNYVGPYWTYRINNGEGVMFDLRVNQTTKEFHFFPVNLVNGSQVVKYSYSN